MALTPDPRSWPSDLVKALEDGLGMDITSKELREVLVSFDADMWRDLRNESKGRLTLATQAKLKKWLAQEDDLPNSPAEHAVQVQNDEQADSKNTNTASLETPSAPSQTAGPDIIGASEAVSMPSDGKKKKKNQKKQAKNKQDFKRSCAVSHEEQEDEDGLEDDDTKKHHISSAAVGEEESGTESCTSEEDTLWTSGNRFNFLAKGGEKSKVIKSGKVSKDTGDWLEQQAAEQAAEAFSFLKRQEAKDAMEAQAWLQSEKIQREAEQKASKKKKKKKKGTNYIPGLMPVQQPQQASPLNPPKNQSVCSPIAQKNASVGVAQQHESPASNTFAPPGRPSSAIKAKQVISKDVEFLRIHPDGRLSVGKVPQQSLMVAGTYSIPECADQLANSLRFEHFAVPGSVAPATARLADRGASVMVLQARGPSHIWFLSVRPSTSLMQFPLNNFVTKLLQKSDMRVYGSALVVKYHFGGVSKTGPCHSYLPVPKGTLFEIRGIKEAMDKAEENRKLEDKFRAFEDSFRPQTLSASCSEASKSTKITWTMSSFGSCAANKVLPTSHPSTGSSSSEWPKDNTPTGLSSTQHSTFQTTPPIWKMKEELEKSKRAEEELKENLQRAEEELKENTVIFPPYWRLKGSEGAPVSKHITRFMKIIVQRVLRASSEHHVSWPDCRPMTNAVVHTVERIENVSLWERYQQLKKQMKKDHVRHRTKVRPLEPSVPDVLDNLDPSGSLDRDMNEKFLFHGTTKENADKIASQGFDERLASSGLYGHGVYFAHEACKAMQYGSRGTGTTIFIVIGRVVMGDPHYTKGTLAGQKRPPERDEAGGRLYDSVVANAGVAHTGRQVHREYIVYDRAQAYPEFIVQLAV